jgi:hypothetical protein
MVGTTVSVEVGKGVSVGAGVAVTVAVGVGEEVAVGMRVSVAKTCRAGGNSEEEQDRRQGRNPITQTSSSACDRDGFPGILPPVQLSHISIYPMGW